MGKEQDYIQVTKEYLQQLEERDAELTQLEINGVDNWVGYGCMCYGEGTSCFFCEDE